MIPKDLLPFSFPFGKSFAALRAKGSPGQAGFSNDFSGING
jgi:hypothetical protein